MESACLCLLKTQVECCARSLIYPTARSFLDQARLSSHSSQLCLFLHACVLLGRLKCETATDTRRHLDTSHDLSSPCLFLYLCQFSSLLLCLLSSRIQGRTSLALSRSLRPSQTEDHDALQCRFSKLLLSS